jgi:hypothetical protein
MGNTEITTRLKTSVNRYLFEERNLLVIGLLRMAMVRQLFHYVLQKRTVEFEDILLNQLHQRSITIELLSKVFFHVPAPLFLVIYASAAVGSFFGIFTRVSLFVFGIFTLYVRGFSASLGVFDHVNCLMSQVVLVLAFIPGSTNLSVDRLVQHYYRYKKGENFLLYQAFWKSKDSIWGMRLMLILLACVYFAAGASKIRFGGLRWLDGNTLSYYLDGRANSSNLNGAPPIFLTNDKVKSADKWRDGFGLSSYSYGNREYGKLGIKAGKILTSVPAIIMAVAIGTVLFELCSFLILIDGWPRTIYLLGAIGMHVGIGFTMNLGFIPYRIFDFLLIDWVWVLSQVPNVIHKKLFDLYNRLDTLLSSPIRKLHEEVS